MGKMGVPELNLHHPAEEIRFKTGFEGITLKKHVPHPNAYNDFLFIMAFTNK